MAGLACDAWWDNVRSLIRHDPAFRWEQQAVSLGDVEPEPITEDTTDETAPTVARLADSSAPRRRADRRSPGRFVHAGRPPGAGGAPRAAARAERRAAHR